MAPGGVNILVPLDSGKRTKAWRQCRIACILMTCEQREYSSFLYLAYLALYHVNMEQPGKRYTSLHQSDLYRTTHLFKLKM